MYEWGSGFAPMSFLDHFIDWAHMGLLENQEALEYLSGRGVSTSQLAKHRIGYVSGEYHVDPTLDPAHNQNICGDREKKGQRCDSCRYLNWSSIWEGEEGQFKTRQIGRRILGCVVFPLTSYSGTFVGFQVRSIKEKSYDTFVLKRRPEGYFFGLAPNLQSIWSSREVFLVEGPTDHLVFERLVSNNVLALTTSSVGQMHFRFLRRFVDVINSCLDQDPAGRTGFRALLESTSSDLLVRDVKYPRLVTGDKDLGDFWKRAGDVAFANHFSKVIAEF